MDFEELHKTREHIHEVQRRIDRIDGALGALVRRSLWLVRVFLGGALVGFVKFLLGRDGGGFF